MAVFNKKNNTETNVPIVVDPLGFQKKVLNVYELLLDDLDYDYVESLKNDSDKLKSHLQNEILKILKSKKINLAEGEESSLVQGVLDELLGFGPAEELLRDSTITDIFINSCDTIFVERRGKVEKASQRFINDDHIYRLVQRVASKSGRHLDLGTPYVDAQLPDGSRLHAIIPPVALNGIKVSIRKFLFQKLNINSLVEKGSLTSEMLQFLRFAVLSRFNAVVCGGTGSGKTTLLNSLLDSIREGERVITIEDTRNLNRPTDM